MLVNLYKRAKKNIMGVLLSVLMIVLVSYLFADFIVIASEENSYGLLALKWLILLVLIFVIVLNIRQVVKVASSPFGREIDVKKERILAKEKLMTKSDRIIAKYRSAS